MEVVRLGAVFGDSVLPDEVLKLLSRRRSLGKRKQGLTALCRQVLLQAHGPLRALEIRERLSQIAPELLKGHKCPPASVETVMNRLCAYGQARAVMISGHRAWESAESCPDDVPASKSAPSREEAS
jgi:hypothetical protein